jgi:hypothetical protein
VWPVVSFLMQKEHQNSSQIDGNLKKNQQRSLTIIYKLNCFSLLENHKNAESKKMQIRFHKHSRPNVPAACV